MSSRSPGCSLTNMTFAFALPSPNTVCVAFVQRSQPLRLAAASRSLGSVGFGGINAETGSSRSEFFRGIANHPGCNCQMAPASRPSTAAGFDSRRFISAQLTRLLHCAINQIVTKHKNTVLTATIRHLISDLTAHHALAMRQSDLCQTSYLPF